MTISPLIAAGTAPASDRDVWAAPIAMRANWKNPITVRTGFQTRIEQAMTLSEQRRLLRGTPRRSISCSLTGTSRVETLAARQLLTRRSMAGFLMPLYSDQMELQSTAAVSATVLSADPDYRRVFAGDRVMVLLKQNGVVTGFEVHEVAAVTASTSITLSGGGLAAEAPAGSLVLPLMESRLVDNYANGFVLTDDKADFQNFTAQEAVGPTQLGGIAAVGSNPSGFDVFDSLPVFDGPLDYSQIRFGINRIGSFSRVGIDQLPVFYGERGVQKFSGLIQCTSRVQAWDFLRFFESRGGRAYPFYFRSPLSDYTYTGSSGNNLLVEDTGDLLDWDFRPYLVMELSDGSYDYREISSVVQNGTNHEIAFVGGAVLGTVVSARQLFKMRMFRDEIAERWITSEFCQMTLEAVEVLEEKTVNMTETLATDTGASIVTDDGTLIGLGIHVAFGATAAISPDLDIGGCEGTTYELTDCDTGLIVLYTNTDLSASVGKVVKVGGTCYEVASNWVQGNPINDVTVDSTADTCEICEAAEPACVASNQTCGNCDDISPESYILNLGGIIPCGTCIDTPAYGWIRFGWPGGSDLVNGEHELTRHWSGEYCYWAKEIPNAITKFWNSNGTDPDCDGGSSSTTTVRIALHRQDTTWRLGVSFIIVGSTPGAPHGSLFYQEGVAEDGDGICATVPNFSEPENDSLGCGSNQGSYLVHPEWTEYTVIAGTSGSATVTCPPVVPCVACDPNEDGTNPSSMSVTAVTGDCVDGWIDGGGVPSSLAFTGYSETANSCVWSFQQVGSIQGNCYGRVTLSKIGGLSVGAGNSCPPVSINEGEWAVAAEISNGTTFVSAWVEQTTGFSCNSLTGKISGAHAFALECEGYGTCTDTPTVTVPT